TGKVMFEGELKRQGLPLSALSSEETLLSILKKIHFTTLDELYAAIGYGGLTAQKAANRVKEELTRLGRLQQEKETAQRLAAGEIAIPASSGGDLPRNPGKSSSGLVVEGLGNCLVKFAKCCSPVPGDPVVGFITRGFGVSVHRADCPNAANERRKVDEAGRWVNVAWVGGDTASYQTSLELSAKDRDNLALDVTMTLSAVKVKVDSFSMRSMPDGSASLSIALQVKDKSELAAVVNKLNQISGVYQVKRTTG
ncbi:MAG: ACT domain-containing protein, partial [Pseudoflavonifractor sp.]